MKNSRSVYTHLSHDLSVCIFSVAALDADLVEEGQQIVHGGALAEPQGENGAGVVVFVAGSAGDLHVL